MVNRSLPDLLNLVFLGGISKVEWLAESTHVNNEQCKLAWLQMMGSLPLLAHHCLIMESNGILN